jgi:hypothetical protein
MMYTYGWPLWLHLVISRDYYIQIGIQPSFDVPDMVIIIELPENHIPIDECRACPLLDESSGGLLTKHLSMNISIDFHKTF